MAARFQQLMVTDSDEDSTDRAVIARRELRSTAAESGRASPRQATVPSARDAPASSYQTLRSPAASHQSVRTPAGGSLMQSPARDPPLVASAPLQSVRTLTSVRRTPHTPAASQQSARTPAAGSVGQSPLLPAVRTVSAPAADSVTPGSFGDDATSPVVSNASADSDGQMKRRVVRRKVTLRRKRNSDPGSRREIVYADENAVRPGRALDAPPSSRSSRAPVVSPPPPPSRLSPRAHKAATSRSGSRATTPAESRVLMSARSHGTDMDSVRPLVPPRSARHSSHPATPRSVAAGADSSSLAFSVDPSRAQSRGTTPPQVSNREALLQRHPQIPSPSVLDESPTPYAMDDNGEMVAMHRAKVRLTKTEDGRQAWVLYSPQVGSRDPAVLHEIAAPPKRLSHRAQDILASKRRSVEEDAIKRHEEAAKKDAPGFVRSLVADEVHESPAASLGDSLLAAVQPLPAQNHTRRTPVQYALPSPDLTDQAAAMQHATDAVFRDDGGWTRHSYDEMRSCSGVAQASGEVVSRAMAERIVRTLQPVQVGSGGGGGCGCVVYERPRDETLRPLVDSDVAHEAGARHYLNLQPMQLANVEVQDIVDAPTGSPRPPGRSLSEGMGAPYAPPRAAAEQRGVATLGGLWCTAEALREDGRPYMRKDMTAPRRVMRICGGQAHGVSLQANGDALEARCYELLLFPREALSPSAVNYGSEGLTLGQLIAPPASSFPLTPRILDDPVTLKEYRKRLLSTKQRHIATVNNEDDRETFADATSLGKPGHYLTLTMVTISARQKYTVELTLVMLPFRASSISGGRTVAEVPRFCPTTVMTYRRLQGLALSFSTKSAFMSAYKALLWATECNIVDVQLGDGDDASTTAAGYSRLRVCATSSPMVPWLSSFGRTPPGRPREETYHGTCLDFAVLTLAGKDSRAQAAEPERRDPLALEDFVVVGDALEANDGNESVQSGQTNAGAKQQRHSSIFTSTLVPPRKADGTAGGPPVNTDTVVGLTPYGVIRRAVSQKTLEVFDVRVLPRNRGRMAPTWDAALNEGFSRTGQQTAKTQQDHLLQQDVEAAIMMEYVSRLPFHSRIYGVLVDEQRYYIFQEPWISALALEQAAAGTLERSVVEYSPTLSSMTQSTAVMSLKDFLHAVLHPAGGVQGMQEEVRLQLSHVLSAQLLLLIISLHGKGMLLGPCPPQRLLVRVESMAVPEEGEETVVDTPDRGRTRAPPPLLSSNVQLFLPDIGVNTLAWGYERQQCGVLEYLPPLYVLEAMLSESIGREERPWTVRDDWWTYLALVFEIFAADGTSLVTPPSSPPVPTPTPTLTKFFSPTDVLDVWRGVVRDSTFPAAGSAAETVAQRVRRYVQRRVMASVSRSVDSWISTKAEELEYYGTTAPKRNKTRAGRAVPQKGSTRGGILGVSLSAAYLRPSREASKEVSAISNLSQPLENPMESRAEEEEGENVLKEMSWVFQMRDFFDAMVDTVFGPASCSVHAPSLRLISHPLFRSLSLPQVFDGTYEHSPAVTQYAAQHLTKTKVHAALVNYRTRSYRGPMASRPELLLMITSSAFNGPAAAPGRVPLLLLSSVVNRDDIDMRESEPSMSRREFVEPSDGLVFSRTNSMAMNANSMPPQRSQSPAGSPWGQQKLRTIYNPSERQSIAALESEVRGALHPFGPRDSLRSRRESTTPDAARPDTPADSPIDPVTVHSRPVKPGASESTGTEDDAASASSSAKLHYDVPASGGANQRRPVSSHVRGNVVSVMAESNIVHGGAAPSTADVWAPPGDGFSSPTQWRNGRRDAPRNLSYSEAGARSGMVAPSDPRGPARTDFRPTHRDIEQSLNDLATHAALQSPTDESRRLPGEEAEVGVGRGPGNRRPPAESAGSRHGHHHRGQRRSDSRHNDRRASPPPQPWANDFLDAATVQKKGQPQRFADPKRNLSERLTIDQHTPQFTRSASSHDHRGTTNILILHESSSEESYVLVASDDEGLPSRGRGPGRAGDRMYQESPTPRNPQAVRSGERVSARDTYFTF